MPAAHDAAADDFGHGTHIAGTIAQCTNNGLGVAGVAYQAQIMPVKVLDARAMARTPMWPAGWIGRARMGLM